MNESLEHIDESLKEKVESLPNKPGIYQFKNKNDTIIYIGKAKSLKSRVKSYFQNKRPVDAKTKAMSHKIADVDVIVVDSEAEAFILEDTLIKKQRPLYNVMLRDDKSYPYVRVTNEEYPRIFYTRNIVKDGSKYYGPFTEVKHLKHIMNVMRSLFFIRSCDYHITEETIRNKKHKVCLDYHIDKCEGPCEGLVSKEKYNDNIKKAIKVLTGKTSELEKQFQDEMNRLAEEMRYEEAARIRNKLQILREYTSRQKIVSMDLVDRDIFALARVDESACSIVFKVRDGKLLGKRHYIIKEGAEQSDEEIIRRTVERWYFETDFIPKEIFLPAEPEELEYLTDWLSKKRGDTVHISLPKIGEKRKMINMAATNAEYILRDYHLAIANKEQAVPRMVTALQRDLRLGKPPRRIECFDNSHLQGSELVSSLVVFQDGRAKKSDYRKFKIKTVHQNDDFAAMREVVRRRCTRLLNENRELPDLVIIDGGKGQLSGAVKVLEELGIREKISIIGLAKRLEEIFLPGNSEPVILPKTSSALRLIQQLRDEAHRFAITFHRQQVTSRTIRTELTDIPGIGEKTAAKLLQQFGSVAAIKKTSPADLEKVVNKKTAEKIREWFDGEGES